MFWRGHNKNLIKSKKYVVVVINICKHYTFIFMKKREIKTGQATPQEILDIIQIISDNSSEMVVYRYDFNKILIGTEPSLDSWKKAFAVFEITGGTMQDHKKNDLEKVARKILIDRDKFFDLYLEEFYPFLNYLKDKKTPQWSLGFIGRILRQFNGKYNDTIYPIKKIKEVVDKRILRGEKTHITVDFDDTLDFSGVPNFGLIKILSEFREKEVTWEILTSRHKEGNPNIEKFINEHIIEFKPSIKNAVKDPTIEGNLNKWKYLESIIDDSRLVIHIDDVTLPEQKIKPSSYDTSPVSNKNILWARIPYIGIPPEYGDLYSEFLAGKERENK